MAQRAGAQEARVLPRPASEWTALPRSTSLALASLTCHEGDTSPSASAGQRRSNRSPATPRFRLIPQSRRNTLRAVHAAGDAAGLNGEGRQPVGLHDLRHSFVAILLASGVSLPEAAALARHANPRVTAAVYAGLTEHSREQFADKLSEAFRGIAASVGVD